MMEVMDVVFYKDSVLKILSGKIIPREVCELRFDLFLLAARFYFNRIYQNDSDQNVRNCEVLEPFPSCFFDFVAKKRRYDDLRLCVGNIPDLNKINAGTSLQEFTWELLHWIFTNSLNINVVKKSEVSEYMTNKLREETKLMSIPYPSESCNRFEIIHPSEINSTKVFLKHKYTFGSFFAYHGSPCNNFHSIIHRGLRCSLNTRKAHGSGTYLTSFLNTATNYAGQYGGFGRGVRYCIAIVEVIKHPTIKVINFDDASKSSQLSEDLKFEDTSSDQHRVYVVNSDDLLRLKHLLVFY